tara:strand:- start:2700 stop:3743 length:1044 start_codon:yes stop_codon:yes gene_type:complete
MSETTNASTEKSPFDASFGSSEEAENAFMSQWESAEKPEEDETKGDAKPVDEVRAAEEAPEQVEVKDETDLQEKDSEDYEYVTVEVDEDGNETIVDEPTATSLIADDDMITKVKVGEDELEVSVKDLKRLHGQEKSLTIKSQEVATQRKALEDKSLQYEASLQKLMEKAQERYKPYAEVDMLVAAKTMSDDDFMQLRRESQMAKEDLDFFTQEASQYATQIKNDYQKRLQEEASKSIKVLKERVPDWSQNLYNDVRSYAINQGLQAEVVDTIVEPTAIEMMIKAMKYDQGKKVATQKRVVRKQKRVLKSGTSNPTTSKKRQGDAMDKLFKSGSTDDATNAFLSKWQK